MEACLLFTIRHAIQYRYQADVFLEPLILRLRPRSDVFQRLIAFDLHTLPEPAGRSDNVDLDGNSSTSLWFNGLCDELSLVATSRVETLCSNPFQFIVTADAATRTPVEYPEYLRGFLEPFLRRIDPCEKLDLFTQEALQAADGQTVPFLGVLSTKIAKGFKVVVRREGPPKAPSVTLERRQGACRDLTLLFMDICRSVGLASRFVSGYTAAPRDCALGELHAWAEVYLPGGGWRGYDPTLGLAVADRHVAAAASWSPEGAAPLVGSFRGDSPSAAMSYTVSVTEETDGGA